MLEIADSTNMADDRRVKIDARKWMAGKLRPKVYGDKVQQEVSGSLSVTWPVAPPPIES